MADKICPADGEPYDETCEIKMIKKAHIKKDLFSRFQEKLREED